LIEVIVIACALGIAIGQILFKLSANAAKLADNFFSPPALIWLFAALCLYGLTTLVWVWVLQKTDLGRVYPFMALAFLVVPVLSYFVFAERFSSNYLIGLGLIFVGLIFVTRA
jgi:drug/metabolite transporter (DMT)-like permease